ncbi:MAG: mechanosensitive ion channel [Lachnospiraceae bacterium]|nr:mechanosensitive ion channel [Lachnospiraceae bacterium]
MLNLFHRFSGVLPLLEASLAQTEEGTLLDNEYTQELKEGAKSAWSTVFSSRFFYAVILAVMIPVLFKIVDLAVRPVRKRNSSPLIAFLAGAVKAVIAIVIIVRIIDLFYPVSGIAEQILMSSSLVVVVLGFVFQEGLSNIVHGFILSVSKPFQIGDRVMVTIDGTTLTGYIRTMGLRSTTIQNVENNAMVIVPNARMDLAVIQNNYMDQDESSTGFLDLSVTYESDLEEALDLVRRCICDNPEVKKECERTSNDDPPMVLVRSFGDSGINLRGIVKTHTVEENFAACSQIRRAVKYSVDQSPRVAFAYPHMHLITEEDQNETES